MYHFKRLWSVPEGKHCRCKLKVENWTCKHKFVEHVSLTPKLQLNGPQKVDNPGCGQHAVQRIGLVPAPLGPPMSKLEVCNLSRTSSSVHHALEPSRRGPTYPETGEENMLSEIWPRVSKKRSKICPTAKKHHKKYWTIKVNMKKHGVGSEFHQNCSSDIKNPRIVWSGIEMGKFCDLIAHDHRIAGGIIFFHFTTFHKWVASMRQFTHAA